MRLHVLSDLHVEFQDCDVPHNDADVVLLPGDIHVGMKGLLWASEAFKGKPVIYVLGNHEYYGTALPKHIKRMKHHAKGTNVHVLENDRIELDGVHFLGCTLWTDFRLLGAPQIAGHEAGQKMTDYKRIRVSPRYRKLRSIDTAALHLESRKWLGRELELGGAGATVVVTHHGPSERSLPEDYVGDLLSASYVSALDELVCDSGATLWVHGHLHNSSDYQLGSTRVLCNPRGYPGEFNPEFDPDLMVEL